MLYRIPFTDTELICKYLYFNGLDYAPYLTGEKEPEGFTREQIQNFRNDILMRFALKQDNVEEDVTIPHGSDVMILREARYLYTQQHYHEYIEFIYLMQGECTEYVGDQQYEMRTGDLLLLAPGTKHCGSICTEDTLLFYIMVRKSTFENAFLSPLTHEDALSVFFSEIVFRQNKNNFFMFHTGENKELQQIVLRLYQNSNKTDILSKRWANLLFELICLEIVQFHLTDLQTKEKKRNELDIISLLKYLDGHLEEANVESVSAHFGYSRGHMDRLIKTNTGYTFREFILRVKMRHAQTLLRNPSLTVHEIALSSGFTEDSSFYRAFKKFYNQTPSEFRKNNDVYMLSKPEDE